LTLYLSLHTAKTSGIDTGAAPGSGRSTDVQNIETCCMCFFPPPDWIPSWQKVVSWNMLWGLVLTLLIIADGPRLSRCGGPATGCLRHWSASNVVRVFKRIKCETYAPTGLSCQEMCVFVLFLLL